jgi:hypothetical protein
VFVLEHALFVEEFSVWFWKDSSGLIFFSEKLTKIIADFRVLRLFILEKHDLSKTNGLRAVVRPILCHTYSLPL